MSRSSHYLIVGAGLSGLLLAVRLGQAGHRVEVVERSGDPRLVPPNEVAALNLALDVRGLDAIEQAGLGEATVAHGVAMHGRMLHRLDGPPSYQPFGDGTGAVLTSVSGAVVRGLLLDAAEESPDVTVRFEHEVVDVDATAPSVEIEVGDSTQTLVADAVIGADGVWSTVRSTLSPNDPLAVGSEYIVLTIPPTPAGEHRLDAGALHIWPSDTVTLTALPNADGSFNATAVWPTGRTEINRAAINQHLVEAFGPLGVAASEIAALGAAPFRSIRNETWHDDDRVLLIGAAAHATVPFHGQHANAALEDVTVLIEDPSFQRFVKRRKRETDLLAELALDRHMVVRDRFVSAALLAQPARRQWLYRLFPSLLEPIYTLTTFSRLAYGDAVRQSRRVNRLLLAVAFTTIAVVVALILLTVVSLVS